MSHLRLYQPDHVDHESESSDDEPVLLSFEQFAATWKKPGQRFRRDDAHATADVVSRARIVYANRRCPYCKHPMVEPVELANSRMSRNQRALPGTATLVGFHCCGCCREWPA